MAANESREAMLKELADYITPSLLGRFTLLGSDAEIKSMLENAKEQKAVFDAMDASRKP